MNKSLCLLIFITGSWWSSLDILVSVFLWVLRKPFFIYHNWNFIFSTLWRFAGHFMFMYTIFFLPFLKTLVFFNLTWCFISLSLDPTFSWLLCVYNCLRSKSSSLNISLITNFGNACLYRIISHKEKRSELIILHNSNFCVPSETFNSILKHECNYRYGCFINKIYV